MRIANLLPMVCALGLAACVTVPTPGDSHFNLQDCSELKGRPLAFAFERLGTATIVDEITPASELRGEFYTPVNRRFPPDAPGSRAVLVREVRWQRGDYYLAVLCTRPFGKWRVFDSEEWCKDELF